jgi:hypothetical protein
MRDAITTRLPGDTVIGDNETLTSPFTGGRGSTSGARACKTEVPPAASPAPGLVIDGISLAAKSAALDCSMAYGLGKSISENTNPKRPLPDDPLVTVWRAGLPDSLL